MVLPPRFDPRHAGEVLAYHRDWVERTRARLLRQRERNPLRYESKPQRIHFGAAQEAWSVLYQDDLERAIWVDTAGQRVFLREDEAHVIHAHLRSWLQTRAHAQLLPWLARKSVETGLAYLRAAVRSQKTRWGSCSSRKVININRALLFLPPALVDYICVHELCHTVHMNHSRRFWDLVERHYPAWRAAEGAMRRANEHVPVWALSDD